MVHWWAHGMAWNSWHDQILIVSSIDNERIFHSSPSLMRIMLYALHRWSLVTYVDPLTCSVAGDISGRGYNTLLWPCLINVLSLPSFFSTNKKHVIRMGVCNLEPKPQQCSLPWIWFLGVKDWTAETGTDLRQNSSQCTWKHMGHQMKKAWQSKYKSKTMLITVMWIN